MSSDITNEDCILAGYCQRERAIVEHADLKTRLESAEAEKDKWRIALESLTPNGSEYVNDLPRCLEFIAQRRQNSHEMILKAVKERKAAEAETPTTECSLTRSCSCEIC